MFIAFTSFRLNLISHNEVAAEVGNGLDGSSLPAPEEAPS
jgi:hypothetical protein